MCDLLNSPVSLPRVPPPVRGSLVFLGELVDLFITDVVQANARLKDLLDRAIQDLANRDGVSKETVKLRLGYYNEED